jgi:hypothetical protein
MRTVEITKEVFLEKVGREPQMDDLKRANCTEVGNVGHYQCGWCNEHDKPRFVCGCLAVTVIGKEI